VASGSGAGAGGAGNAALRAQALLNPHRGVIIGEIDNLVQELGLVKKQRDEFEGKGAFFFFCVGWLFMRSCADYTIFQFILKWTNWISSDKRCTTSKRSMEKYDNGLKKNLGGSEKNWELSVLVEVAQAQAQAQEGVRRVEGAVPTEVQMALQEEEDQGVDQEENLRHQPETKPSKSAIEVGLRRWDVVWAEQRLPRRC
jgi:hypothetical protein